MSIQAVAWVLEHSEAEGYDRLVLLAIANHVHLDSDQAWPSIALLASEARVDRATVYRAIHRLIAIDELEVDHGGGRGNTNSYHLKGLPRATVKTPGNGRSWQQNGRSWQQKGRSRATLNHKNRNEPKQTVVVCDCFNCGRPTAECFCGYAEGTVNADR